MMGKWIRRLCVITVILGLSTLLLACGQDDGSSSADLVAFDRLVADPQRYAGRYLCTGGVHVEGFEASGLAAAMAEKDGHPQLAEPVIWLEGADFQSREDCTRTDTQPSFEFCQAVICGVFEAGGGYGHGSTYAYQLRGRGVSELPGATSPAVGPIQIAEGFEFGMDGWKEGADVPQDPNHPGRSVAWAIEPSAELPMEGSRSVKFYLDGGQDDGTIWLMRSLDISSDRDLMVTLRFNLWSESESFNARALVAAYAGPRRPEVEADFDLSQPADLSVGWRRYDYAFRISPGDGGELWVGMGISAVWETEMTYYLDSVEIEIETARPTEDTPPAPPAYSAPPDATPVGREPRGQSAAVEPPPVILEAEGQQQVSGIGTYCWSEPAEEEIGVAVCADMAGIPTVEEPLLVSSPFKAAFRLAPEETADELLLEVIPVTEKDEFEEWPAGWRGWAFKEGERYNLPLEREPVIELSLEPGLYALNLVGWWQVWGDASYGFLVQVTENPPILFSYHRDGATELWTIDPTSGAVEPQIQPEQTVQDPALSPSGETIAYVRVTGNYGGVVSELWLMDGDGGNPRPLHVPPAGQSVLSRPTWQPDGQEVYFLQLGSGTDSQLLRMPVTGGEPTLVLTDCIDFALTHDGQWLASISLGRRLTVYGRDGSRLRDLVPRGIAFADYHSLAASHDGNLLAFRAVEAAGEDTWNLYVMDWDGHNVRRLTDLDGFHPPTSSSGQVNGLAWTADGAYLVYSVDGDPEQTGIWRVGVGGGERRRLFTWGEGEWLTVQGPWLESASPLPVLAVDEYPIVAAEVDGPGHLEYTDRLGDDILARIEGLRAHAAERQLIVDMLAWVSQPPR